MAENKQIDKIETFVVSLFPSSHSDFGIWQMCYDIDLDFGFNSIHFEME